MEYIGVGRRVVAAILDIVILFIIFYLIALATRQTTEGGFNLTGAPAFLGFLVGILYYVAFEALLGGTIGKLVLGVRVVQMDGSRPGWGPALVRNVLRIVDFLPFLYIVGIVCIALNKKKQRVGDMVAHTAVVRAASVTAPAA